jgi:hypothetical protein
VVNEPSGWLEASIRHPELRREGKVTIQSDKAKCHHPLHHLWQSNSLWAIDVVRRTLVPPLRLPAPRLVPADVGNHQPYAAPFHDYIPADGIDTVKVSWSRKGSCPLEPTLSLLSATRYVTKTLGGHDQSLMERLERHKIDLMAL